jgi:phenylpropionate dioxygenase-like ring-hydroxylating dioxygenase large terminal subunit
MDGKCFPVSGPRTATEKIDYARLIDRDRIHGSLYTSEAVFRDEMDKIFSRGWVFVGHESEIPNPGDYIARNLGLEPAILLRNREGEVRVFSNRCMHRGNKLCIREKGSAKALTCDYHGWTFSLNGDLVGVPYPGGFEKDKALFGLNRPAKVESYQGFVFTTFNPESISLDEHLGHAKALIDRAVSMSPNGKIDLKAGWVKQHYSANWKMLPENDTDGYHANHVHSSFLRVFRSQYDAINHKEEERLSRIIDWGQGHTAIDASTAYQRPYEWLGVTEDRVADYTKLMVAAYGEEKARRITTDGPPHAVVFPNLFLGELNIVIFQPISANEAVQWHTPMLLDGVPDSFNSRIIRQSEAAMGPSAFLLADDSVISERQQIALSGHSGWLDLSRGLNREREEEGVIMSHISDETTNRGFWRHYLKVMGEQ